MRRGARNVDQNRRLEQTGKVIASPATFNGERWTGPPRRAQPRVYFFGAASGEGLGSLVVLAGACSAARRARFLSRFLACARLRVFSRALSFGIVGLQ